MAESVTLHVVQTVPWSFNGEHYEADEARFDAFDGGDAVPAGDRPLALASFLLASKAEARCRELEQVARAGCNPFEYGRREAGVVAFSTLPEGEFWARLERAGFERPSPGGSLFTWFDRAASSGADLGPVWEACDRVRFHKVVPARVPLGEAREEL